MMERSGFRVRKSSRPRSLETYRRDVYSSLVANWIPPIGYEVARLCRRSDRVRAGWESDVAPMETARKIATRRAWEARSNG